MIQHRAAVLGKPIEHSLFLKQDGASDGEIGQIVGESDGGQADN